jgi:hypothetical protein
VVFPEFVVRERLQQEVQEWRKFRRALRKEDQQFLDRLFEEARLHVHAGVYASRPWPFETILISILLEHEKALAELRLKLKSQEEQEGHTKGLPVESEPDSFMREE